jgi:DNA-binding CsgD family transcriptional regulator
MGAGYCCQIFNDNLYLGTNQGLFVKSFRNFINNTGQFELVKNTAGQVWSLTVADNQLICGHNFGVFSVVDKTAIKIGQENGAWKFIPLRKHPDYLMGGFYNGLAILKKSGNGYLFYKKIQGFNESSRFLCEDQQGKIWISHGSKGIYRIELNSLCDSVVKTDFFGVNDGLPSDFGNIVFEIDNEIAVSTIDGFYQLVPDSDRFIKSVKLSQIFKTNSRIKTLHNDENGNYWFIADKESGVFRKNEDLTYTKITAPFTSLHKNFINEFEFIYPYNDEHVFIGVDNGVAHYSPKFSKSYSQEFKAYITKIEIPYLDSVIFLNHIYQPAFQPAYPFRKNEFRFHFAAPFFENDGNLEFSYFLENYSTSWSEWSPISFRDFTHLDENNYTLKLKARNKYGAESEITSFQFKINPPWYRSNIAYLVYFVFLVLMIFSLIIHIRQRVKKLKNKERLKHELELKAREEQFQLQSLKAEKEIIRLRNEKLKDEMVFRDKELANQTMNIIQKNKFLFNLIDELQRIQSTTEDQNLKNKMISLKKKIQREIDEKQQNKVFETYFDEVHNEFFNRMKDKYPDLSPKELRLCAYIRMNISTKEIASLLNISYRGVEINRYRLRKKLDLPRDIILPTFLSNI